MPTLQIFFSVELPLFHIKELNAVAKSKACLHCVASRRGKDDEWQGVTSVYLVFKRAVQLRAEEPQL